MSSSNKEFNFDKFIKDIETREKSGRDRVQDHLNGQEEIPARKHNKLYREHWQNSTRFIRREK